MRFFIFLFFVALSAASYANDLIEITEKEEPIRLRLRATLFAEKTKVVNNPARWLPIRKIVPDGDFVEEGEMIAELDHDEALKRMKNLEFDKSEQKIDLERRRAELKNKELQLVDQLEDLKGKLNVLLARQKALKNLPEPIQVRLSEGQLKVAEMNFEVSQKEFGKGQSRFKREMISKAELEKLQKDLDLRQVELNYAKAILDYEKLPAASSSLRKVELQIENLNMDISQLEEELEANRKIFEIQLEGIEARQKILESRMKRQQEEVDNTKIYSPTDGYVSYTRRFRDILFTGTKMRKNMPFLKIPNLDSLALKASIPERDRPYFSEGDPVDIRIFGELQEVYKGKIHTISKISRAIDDKEESQFKWGKLESQSSAAMKVVDLVIRFDEAPEMAQPGMHAWCEITSNKPVQGPAVPLTHVRFKEGKSYLALEGLYQSARGRVLNRFFFLEEDSWVGKKVSALGRFPIQATNTKDPNSSTQSFYAASGELTPLESSDITVRRVWGWPKVTWLVEENTQVSPGDNVVQLDTKDIDEEISKREEELKAQVSEMETQEKRLALTKKKNIHRLKKQANLLEIAEIDKEIALKGRNAREIYSTRRNVQTNQIRLNDAEKRFEKLKSKDSRYVSKSEVSKLQREVSRTQLRYEASKIQAQRALRGADEVTRSKAELEYLKQKVAFDILKKQIENDELRDERNLKGRKNSVKRRERRLDRLRRNRANYEIKSESSGMVRYTKILNNGLVSKVNIGSTVSRRFKLMEIADNSKMVVRVELPEHHYRKISKGMKVDIQIPSLSNAKLSGEVNDIELLFDQRRKDDANVGLYSSHESLGETVFYVKVIVESRPDLNLKPGAVAKISFPFKT